MFKSFAIGVAALALSAGSALANIVVVQGGVPQNPGENVLMNTGTTGTTVFGTTNQSGTSISFTGNETLILPSNGQARLEASDGAFTVLSFTATNPLLAFSAVEFNLNAATTGTAVINFIDQFNNVFGGTFTIASNGQNFFNAIGTNGEVIRRVTINSQASVADIRQVRVGPATIPAIPEPATWGMMIVGFGMIGLGMRLSRRRTATAAV
jgi:hypothetical protein